MPSIFPSAPGQVIRVDTGRVSIPFSIDLPDFPISSAIITEAAMQHQGNYQFLHSLQDFIYVYVFGDKIGTLQVTGIAFLDICPGGNDGLIDVLQFYAAKRIGLRGLPVRVGFGPVPFETFLTRGQFRAVDSGEAGSLGRFTFVFHTFPD